ncbi:sulfate and thiosulfate import ATP-binding protein CysA [Methyloceanibacter caenitepidi]|uniref:Sulfate and thiosulfate import ATP-binding protein CysA n=2 Tax=Methyloceanibacter caenitepidi TaxID=1384459 RepID=A0A0A8K120_9HYPH|nr:sulfate and thiosulfate import ATP-binding protein CysA [Methyloceanibacter caenitepidi]
MDAWVSKNFDQLPSQRQHHLEERPMDVTVENVVRTFGTTAALHGVSLHIRAGELIALLGPSGSGKTTLLRILAGLDAPTSGRVLFDRDDALKLTVQERNVGLVFQSYALFRHMTVLENVGFGLSVRPRSRRPSRSEIKRRALELLDLVQLSGLDTRYPTQLSGGQRQRVAFARALAIEPRVLLLDEPFGALDAKVRRDLRRWLREIHDQTGHTTVFVTHDQEEALELADRVVVLNNGKIEQVGTPDEIYDSPNSPYVFSFIGESSVLSVSVDSGEVWLGGRRLGIPACGLGDGPGQLFLRPHDIDVVPSDGDGIFGTFTAVRRHGGAHRFELEVDGTEERIEVELPSHVDRAVGDTVGVLPRRWRVFA